MKRILMPIWRQTRSYSLSCCVAFLLMFLCGCANDSSKDKYKAQKIDDEHKLDKLMTDIVRSFRHAKIYDQIPCIDSAKPKLMQLRPANMLINFPDQINMEIVKFWIDSASKIYSGKNFTYNLPDIHARKCLCLYPLKSGLNGYYLTCLFACVNSEWKLADISIDFNTHDKLTTEDFYRSAQKDSIKGDLLEATAKIHAAKLLAHSAGSNYHNKMEIIIDTAMYAIRRDKRIKKLLPVVIDEWPSKPKFYYIAGVQANYKLYPTLAEFVSDREDTSKLTAKSKVVIKNIDKYIRGFSLIGDGIYVQYYDTINKKTAYSYLWTRGDIMIVPIGY